MSDDKNVYITVCTTCLDTNLSGEEGIGAGAKLLSILEEQLSEHPYKDTIIVRPIRCLMACSEGCALSIGCKGKMKYLLARMSADSDVTTQLLDFAAMYADAPYGITPNHEWPPLIGQFFIGRVPPSNKSLDEWNDMGSDL